MRVVITGSDGYVGAFIVERLLSLGHEVVGIDNQQRWGPGPRAFYEHPEFTFIRGDAADSALVESACDGAQHLILAAATVGDVRSFHASPYSIFRDNELLGLAGLDAAIAWINKGWDLKVTLLSSSMVFESASTWPSAEGSELSIAPPRTSYGIQKLAFESAARAASKQYGLRYTILRLFNAVGVPQSLMAAAQSGESNANLPGLSHVLPDLVRKSMQTSGSLEVLGKGDQVRHFTHGRDIAEALSLSLNAQAADNEDFNVAHHSGVTVKGLVEKIWSVIHGSGVKPDLVSLEAIPNDVNRSEPDVSKAKRLLGFSARTGIDETVREVVEFVRISKIEL